MLTKVVSVVSFLKDLGVFDKETERIFESVLRSKVCAQISRKYGLSDAEMKAQLERYGKQVLLLIFLPHAKITIPSMIVYELIKAHFSTNKRLYLSSFRHLKKLPKS